MIRLGLKPRRVSGFIMIAFESVKSRREDKQKNIISGQFFSSSSFLNSWKFGNEFRCQQQMLLINYQYFRGYTIFFVKILTSDETDLKHAVKMPLHQGCCLLHNAAYVLLSKSDGILSYRGLKKSYFMWQKTC